MMYFNQNQIEGEDHTVWPWSTILIHVLINVGKKYKTNLGNFLFLMKNDNYLYIYMYKIKNK